MKKLNKALIVLVLALSLVTVTTACSQPAVTPPVTETPANPVTPPPASTKVVVYAAGPGTLSKNIAAAFTAKTGIEVEAFDGTTGSVLGRLEAESSNPIADVVILASWPSGMDLKQRGLLMQYTEASNAELLHEKWNDDFYLFGYSASALGITYNTLLISEPGLDWQDYTLPRFKGMVTMPDPSLSGSALDFIAGYISNNPAFGWALFEDLQKNELLVDGANRPALNAVVTGAKAVVLAGVDYMAYADMAKGEPLNIVYPTSGTVVNPRPAMILKSARNLDNAKLFMDFLLSDEAQQLVADAYIIPGRRDVPAHPDRLGMEDIVEFEIDWNWMSRQQQEINSRFQQIFR